MRHLQSLLQQERGVQGSLPNMVSSSVYATTLGFYRTVGIGPPFFHAAARMRRLAIPLSVKARQTKNSKAPVTDRGLDPAVILAGHFLLAPVKKNEVRSLGMTYDRMTTTNTPVKVKSVIGLSRAQRHILQAQAQRVSLRVGLSFFRSCFFAAVGSARRATTTTMNDSAATTPTMGTITQT